MGKQNKKRESKAKDKNLQQVQQRQRDAIMSQLQQDPDHGERQHFFDVCWSCLKYYEDAIHEVGRIQDCVHELDQEDLDLWGTDLRSWMATVHQGIEANTRFLQMLPTPDVCGAPMNRAHAMCVYQVPEDHRVASRNSSKVRTTLRQFIRDWAVEGQVERDFSYQPLIDALFRHLPPPARGSGARKPRVLCPGSGLGRLPFDLARVGYAAQGNEFSYHMLLGSHLIYNRTQAPRAHTIYPFIVNTVNRRKSSDNLRFIQVPDVVPCLELPEDAEVSMAAGEFIAVYEDQVREWDAIATAFFIDTAKNIFLYIRTIAAITRPGGIWTNVGPLLFHFADVIDEVSIELSWEEVRPGICKYFNIIEEDMRNANYTMNMDAMQRTVFKCIFFTAIRNDVPVEGKSNPVY